ncbi:PTS family beta-glucoside [Lactobacillus kefiranofaciens subsp. kefirgranum DSM 10550 = JCM 8572]|nr:PTS family beta-glucoside [Lactobacillus kefiranofaciens subsp. kefirgranum DSM 10550 = JCM 8572]
MFNCIRFFFTYTPYKDAIDFIYKVLQQPLMGLGVALVFAFWLAKSARMKTTMRTVLVPSIFNVSEPMTYGLPVVLNPIIFIPWILAPMASTLISYIAIAIGWVPRPIGATVVWSTPIFISGWLGTGSVAGAILQLVDVVVMTLIFIPFLMVLDKSYVKDEQAQMAKETTENN